MDGMNEDPKNKTSTESMFGVRVIAIYKLIKGALLVCVGFGALALIDHDVANLAAKIVADMRVDPDNRHIHGLLLKLGLVDNHMLRQISLGTFIYAAVVLIEGFGLLWDKLWAEYFTVIVTALFVPVELYEIYRHMTPSRVAVLFVNVTVVWYLVSRLKHRRHPPVA